MYLDPLMSILDSINRPGDVSREYSALTSPDTRPSPKGIYALDPTQTLVLLLDLKSSGLALNHTWHLLQSQLEPLRERGFLTYWESPADHAPPELRRDVPTSAGERVIRPLTIVVSGNAPFDRITESDTYRDIFYDAPMNALVAPEDRANGEAASAGSEEYAYALAAQNTEATDAYKFKYNPSNSYLASSPFIPSIGGPIDMMTGALSQRQKVIVREQVKQAKRRGLVPRYWGTPRWPRSLRDGVWEQLVKEEVGMLNVDDLRAARKGTWGRWGRERGQQHLAFS